MRYRPTGEEELVHGLFGGEMTRPRRQLCCKIHLQSLDNNRPVILRRSMRKRYVLVSLSSNRVHGYLSWEIEESTF